MAGMDSAFSSATRDTCVDWAGSLHTKRTVWFTVPTISAVKTPCSAAAAVAVGRLLRLATLRRSCCERGARMEQYIALESRLLFFRIWEQFETFLLEGWGSKGREKKKAC